MDFSILGPLTVSGPEGPVPLGGPKQRLVLALLIARAGDVVPRERLIDEVWGDEPPDAALSTLRGYVSHLRKELGGDRLVGRSPGYVLTLEPDELDARRFESLVRDARRRREDPEAALGLLDAALALWRGPAFADLSNEPSLRGEISRLEDLRLSATEQKAVAELALGRHTTVVGRLEVLTEHYPLRERLWASLMLALYRNGRQAEALDAYRRVREVLAEELGIDPSPELQELHERILRQDPELKGPVAVPPAPRAPAAGDLQPGTEFAGYRIDSVLGRGGMSVVYLAEHLALQRKVALKILAPRLAEDARFRDRFVRESRIAAGLEHPNIVPIYEAGAAEGFLFIAMRYIRGTDLGRLIRDRGTLDPRRATRLVGEVAGALDAAHATGLVHRDVKPGNILVVEGAGSEGRDLVYLSDFGLTKRLEGASAELTRTGQFVGTIDYVAPEQIEGRTLDGRADVYSLASVLFECLTGTVPYRRESEVAALYAHLREKPPRVTGSRPDLPAGLDKVFARGLSRVPSSRYGTCGELVAAAREELEPAGRDGAERVGRASGRSGRIAAALVSIALVAAAIAFVATRTGSGGERGGAGTASTVSARTASPEPSPNFRTVGRALTDAERQLLAFIPKPLASNCRPLDRGATQDLGALVCSSGPIEVLYERFGSVSDMYALFDTNVAAHGASDGNCATQGTAVMPYAIKGQPAGRMLCYRTSGSSPSYLLRAKTERSHVEWTDERTLIYAHAVRDDAGDLSLFDWWLSSSGPIAGAGDDGGKDAPGRLAPRLPGGSYLLSLTQREATSSGLGSIGGIKGVTLKSGWKGTWAMSVEPGSYELAHNGTIVETGTTALQKPTVVIFTPTSGDCSLVDPDPSAYAWSASGSTIAWTSVRSRACAGPQPLTGLRWSRAPRGQIVYGLSGDLYLADGAGLHRVQLTQVNYDARFFSTEPVWSPSGQRIAYAAQANGTYGIYVMNHDGSGATKLTDSTSNEWDPAWSPDGESIAFHAHPGGYSFIPSEIDVASTDGSGLTTLVAEKHRYVGRPVWSPDGSRIAFKSSDRIDVMDADGANVTKIHRGTHRIDTPSWSPDGTRIVFWDAPGGKGNLFSMRADGTDVRPLFTGTRLPGRDLVVDTTPDGRWLVVSEAWFVELGNQIGLHHPIYLISADGRRVYTIVDEGFEPRWRPGTT